MAKSKRLSVSLSAGSLPCPYGIACCRVYALFTKGYQKNTPVVRCVVSFSPPRDADTARLPGKDVRLPGKGNSNSHGARPVHRIITMIKWIRTSRLSMKKSLSVGGGDGEGGAAAAFLAVNKR